MITRRTVLQGITLTGLLAAIPAMANLRQATQPTAPIEPTFSVIHMATHDMQQGDRVLVIDPWCGGEYEVGQAITAEMLDTYSGEPNGYASYDHASQTYHQLHRVR